MVWPWLTNSNYFSHSLTWYIHIGLKRETCQGPRCPCEKPEPHRDSCRCQLHQELHFQGYFLWHPLDWHLLNNTLVNWSLVCSPGTVNFLELSRLVTKWECCVLQIFPMFTTVVDWVQNSLLPAAQYDYKYTVICLWTHCLINFFFLWRITKNSVTELSKNDIIPSTHLWESIFRRRHLLWLWLLNISHFIYFKKTLRTGPPVDLREYSGNNLECRKKW